MVDDMSSSGHVHARAMSAEEVRIFALWKSEE